MSEFHFILPVWLLAVLPAIFCFTLLLKQRLQQGNWQQIIDKSLLPHLIEDNHQKQTHKFWFAVLLAWMIACVSLAGPSWKKLPMPVIKKQDALVIILDMSLSMFAEDQQPSRLARAKHKAQDVLTARKEGLTALITYSGDSHVVTPLTDDSHTVASLIPALNPAIMPSYGSRIDLALLQANELIESSNNARILLITDGITQSQLPSVQKALGKNALSILAVGTEQGSPISLPEQGLLKDNGQIVISKLDMTPLYELQKQGALLHKITLDNSDINALLPITQTMLNSENDIISERTLERWDDMGYWLIIILIPLCLLGFRQGQLAILFVVLSFPIDSYADWEGLWKNNNQQAATKFEDKPAEAAALFDDANWQGASHYQAGNYDQALQAYARSDDNNRHYNTGNTLAKLGQLEDAIKAYDEAIKLNADNHDAINNKALVEKLLEKQKKNQKNEDQKGDNKDKNDDSKEGDKDGEKSSEQQDKGDNKDTDKGEQGDKSDDSKSQKSDGQSNSDEQNKDINESLEQQKEKQKEEQSKGSPKNETDEDKDKKSGNTQAEEHDEPSEEELAEQKAQQQKQDKEESQDLSPTEDQQSTQKPSGTNPALEKLTDEEQQSMAQWLRRVPDDPSGLLRRKFAYQHQLKQQQQQTQSKEGPLW
jgi:Ca-activated chloride channel family protein